MQTASESVRKGDCVMTKRTADAPKEQTDCLFRLRPGSWKYSGVFEEAIRFTVEQQLRDVRLWKLFARQFCFNADDGDHGWRCEYWGKMMRGACFTYAYTKDPGLYQVMETSVRDLLTAQDSLGRFSTYSAKTEFCGWDIWGRKYVLLGLEYFYELCPDEGLCAQILTAMTRHLDYILAKIGPKQDGKLPITLASDNWRGLNSCSLLEPVVRLYTLTQEPRFLQFADYIVGTGGIEGGNLFELALEGRCYPFQYPVTKAYEMMSCFEGLLEYYRVTGQEKWRRATENFVRLVMESDITVIGCAGCTHELFDHSAAAQTDEERNRTIHMQETCVTVTWMKLCDQLLCLTGESIYADAIERSACNALLGALNTGRHTQSMKRSIAIFYPDRPELRSLDFEKIILPFDSYSPLLPNIRGKAVGGLKFMQDGTYYGCCAAIGSAGTGLVPNSSVMRRVDGISVNLYLPGVVLAETPAGNPVRLRLETGYPADGKIRITVELQKPELFTLALRIPSWSEKTVLRIENETRPASAGSFAELSHVWNPQDRVELELDFRVIPIRKDGFLCLRRGPVILARDARFGDDVERPVNVLCGEDGSVCASAVFAPFSCRQAYEIRGKKGDSFCVADYASAGQSWDEQSRMAAWYPEAVGFFCGTNLQKVGR